MSDAPTGSAPVQGRKAKDPLERASEQQKLWLSPAQKAAWEAARDDDRWRDDFANWIKRAVDLYIRGKEKVDGYDPPREKIRERAAEILAERQRLDGAEKSGRRKRK